MHLVSAWAARQQIVLGQQAAGETSNETAAIPPLPKHLELKGAPVAMDAMGTRTEIARAIHDGGADYCMSKKNWPTGYAEVEQLFDNPPDNVAFETKETVDLTGGRSVTRDLSQSRQDDIGLLSQANPTVSLKNRRQRPAGEPDTWKP